MIDYIDEIEITVESGARGNVYLHPEERSSSSVGLMEEMVAKVVVFIKGNQI